MEQLTVVGQFTFWALLVYGVVRLGDLAVRGQLGAAFAGPKAGALPGRDRRSGS